MFSVSLEFEANAFQNLPGNYLQTVRHIIFGILDKKWVSKLKGVSPREITGMELELGICQS